MKIRMRSIMSGPGGSHAIGEELIVGDQVDAASARSLIAGGYAEEIIEPQEKAVISPPEKAVIAPAEKRGRRR